MNKQDFKAEWTEHKQFNEGDVCVIVHKSNHRTPRYRIEVSFHVEFNHPRDGKKVSTVRSLSPKFERANGKVTTQRYADTVRRLFADAEGYVQDMMQAAEDEWIEGQIERGKRDNSKAPVGLKTLAKRDKEKRDRALAEKAAEVPKPE